MSRAYSNYADIIDFTRASTGTYLDSDGLLKTASVNTPRIEYDADGNLLGLLVEEARTNLFPYSQDFGAVDWDLVSLTRAIATGIDAPNGENSAYLLTSNASSASYLPYKLNYSSASYTLSFFVKAGNHSVCWIYCQSATSYGVAFFDLSNGTTQATAGSTSTPTNLNIEDCGNGWHRISAVFVASGASGSGIGISDAKGSLSCSSGKTLYIYGAQLEAGSFPTSYIPTSGSTATRSADVASLGTSAFGYNQDEGSVVVEVNALGIKVNTTQGICALYNDGGNRHYMYFFNALVGGVTLDDGASQANISGKTDYAPDAFVKSSYAYKINDFTSIVNGGTAATDASGSLALGINSLLIGRSDAPQFLNGHIKSLKYYPRRLTNAQLQALTS